MSREILLLPAVKCPVCGSAPPFRISPAEVERQRERNPGAFVMSVKCPNCAEVYPITVAAYLQAS
jgi:ssDNA-binding Zn-finger/Zn-ribbon topoisomerase 1